MGRLGFGPTGRCEPPRPPTTGNEDALVSAEGHASADEPGPGENRLTTRSCIGNDRVVVLEGDLANRGKRRVRGRFEHLDFGAFGVDLDGHLSAARACDRVIE